MESWGCGGYMAFQAPSFPSNPHAEGPAFGLMVCCCHLEMINNLWTQIPIFSFCSGTCKLCHWSCPSTIPRSFPTSKYSQTIIWAERGNSQNARGRAMMKESGGNSQIEDKNKNLPLSQSFMLSNSYLWKHRLCVRNSVRHKYHIEFMNYILFALTPAFPYALPLPAKLCSFLSFLLSTHSWSLYSVICSRKLPLIYRASWNTLYLHANSNHLHHLVIIIISFWLSF